MKSTRICKEKLAKIYLRNGPLEMIYCPKPEGIEKYFSQEVRRISFPPLGKAEISELDVYYLIKQGETVVGYYKAVDLFFNGEIELHGSYDGPKTFLVKSYFFLTREFVYTIQNLFPDKRIKVLISKSNNKVVRLLEWLKFEETKEECDSVYRSFILNNPAMLKGINKIIHTFYK